MGPDQGMGPGLGTGSGLGMGPDKGRAGDSNVAGLATVKANGRDGLLPVLVWRCAPSCKAPTERPT